MASKILVLMVTIWPAALASPIGSRGVEYAVGKKVALMTLENGSKFFLVQIRLFNGSSALVLNYSMLTLMIC